MRLGPADWTRIGAPVNYFVMKSLIGWKVVYMTEAMMVAKELDLKQIERRAYMSYHQDGLLDIFGGVYILGFALGILTEMTLGPSFGAIMPVTLAVVVLPIWITAKRKITMPRIGFVRFGSQATIKLMALYAALFAAGLGAFFAIVLHQSGLFPWLDAISQNALLIVGIGSLAVCFLFGYSMGLRRLYGYGLLALTLFAIGHFIGIFFAYLLLALAATTMAVGFALLIGFVRKYPLQGEKAVAK